MTHPVRVKYAGAIFAAVIFVLLIGFVEIHDSNRIGSLFPQNHELNSSFTAEQPADAREEPDCAQMENTFAANLDESRSCLVDTDCSLTRFECPFECVASVSKSLIAGLKGEEASFQQSCGRCESDCPQTLAKWRAACVRQRCIVLDRSIEELEEETLQRINE